MILTVKLVFTLATLSFIVGFRARHSNNPLHRKLMVMGFVYTVSIAVILVAGVHLFGETYAPAGWLVSVTGSMAGAKGVLIAHRAVATLTLLALVTQVVTGWRRHPLHKKLYRWTAPLWLVTYVSGMVVFV